MSPQETAALVTNRRDLRCPFAPAAELTEIRDDHTALPTVPVMLPTREPGEARAITRYADVRQVLGDARFAMGFGFDPDAPRTLGNQPGFLLNYNGPEHVRLRRMLTAAFTVKRVERMRPQIEQIITTHLDAMAEAGPGADLVAAYALPIPSQVICELLGVPYADREDFQRRSELILDVNSTAETLIRTVGEFTVHMAELVRAHRADPGDSLLGVLVREHGDELTDDELVGIAILVLIAGHETTSNMIGLSTLALLKNPDQLTLVRDTGTATNTAVEELLRQLAIAGPLIRQATEDIVVGGHEIKAGELVVVSPLAANWDRAFIGEADELDVRRKPLPHLTFGFGPHQCLGQQLARMELRIAIPALLRRFPSLRLAVPESELRFRVHAPVYGLKALPVTW